MKKKPGKNKESLFSNISIKQAKDTGMAMVLICLIINIFGKDSIFNVLAILFLVINMVVPLVYKPVAIIWLSFSKIIGTIMSKILLVIVFFLIVTPMGITRRLLGKDSLKLKSWKKDHDSVFVTRNNKFCSEDVEAPY